MNNEYLVVGCFLVELVKFYKTATKLLLFFYPRKKKRIKFRKFFIFFAISRNCGPFLFFFTPITCSPLTHNP